MPFTPSVAAEAEVVAVNIAICTATSCRRVNFRTPLDPVTRGAPDFTATDADNSGNVLQTPATSPAAGPSSRAGGPSCHYTITVTSYDDDGASDDDFQ